MRRWLILLSLACAVEALAACPVSPPGLCDYGACDPPDGAVLDSGDTGSDAPPVNCPSGKEPKDDPTCVTNDVGVFVSATGNDSNAGTKEKPLATLGAALTKAGGAGKGKIFVCEGSYTESVEIKATVGVYGGFKCADWSYSGTKPKFAGAKPDYVVKIDGASGVTIADLELDGKDGAPNSGESSIALFVTSSAGVKVDRSALNAGAGAVGAAGTMTPFSFQTPPNGGNATGSTGGPAVPNNCPGGDVSQGGKGGNGTLNNLFNAGAAGTPALGGGKGGDGGATCDNGSAGAAATPRTPSAGASTSGSLGATGWQPSAGTDGVSGQAGQGGGGGGGADNGSSQGGGGAGGTGGCGGAPGKAGKGGGGSIALLANASTVTLAASELASGVAGAGGSGAAGQPGQSQVGNSGTSQPPGCIGGSGGAGGAGGAGGGGAGGVSVGILYKGVKPVTDVSTDGKIKVGTKGGKGVGGATPSNDGIDGVAQAVLQVP